MNRIAHDRVSELSATKVQLFKPVNNWLINFYLDGFKRREKREEEPTILSINYLTLILYVVALAKSLVCFGKLSRTSKLILFDFAAFFGGIELYNRILVTCTIVIGLILTIVLRISNGCDYRGWTQVFEMTRRNGKMDNLFLTGNIHNEILVKLAKAMRVVYKLMNISIFNLGM